MKQIRIGIFGFGKTGKVVAHEFLNESLFTLAWVVRKSNQDHHKYASRLLGHEFDAGEIFSIEDIHNGFFLERPVDALVDFSGSTGIYLYKKAAEAGIPIVAAISKYEQEEINLIKTFSKYTAVLHSPNITLGINVLMVAAQILQKIAPHADIEIVEEHFKGKKETSGTAVRIANVLGLNVEQHLNSIRVGGIVGRHEIIFGMPNQTIRLLHESISRAAFGQGAIFAVKYLLGQPPGLYTMETIIAEMFRENIPVY
ncbi:4-hydroxy-tetrahydrodipicolinate reductase [Sporomusa acidovorans]|uniref:4-hydroxy-tetrahydrodipicolinate reductase n=1 Tax=Sporomusa acidovorans (strain ATCC 49682 / DSM 3132 / Mol) TaxID=1123286 RepID=A0ABZ3J2C7_SPOA4|nr:dihydrodipicolinate reductase C-terminal domain-containing protein [Sporomusa acidovorans]OZC21996.1 4-hydroxy-tetrahydrodipicolinate reductase [Sporomusa acidovorans DSM 3132]SDF80104.1 4-hydroxy-tetrahydrodipicolinate reductase [Sporomusa acidovorans]